MANNIFDLLGGFGEGTLSDEEGMEFLRRLVGDAPIGEAPSGTQLAKEAEMGGAETMASALSALDVSGVLPLLLAAEGGPIVGQALRTPGALLNFIKSRQAQKALNEFVDIAARREAEKATMRNVNQKMSKELRARPSDNPAIQRRLYDGEFRDYHIENPRNLNEVVPLRLDDFAEAMPGNTPQIPSQMKAGSVARGADAVGKQRGVGYDDYYARTPRGEGFTVNRAKIDDLKERIMREGFDASQEAGGPFWLTAGKGGASVQGEGHHRIRALQELVAEGAIDPASLPPLRTYLRYGKPHWSEGKPGLVDTPGAFVPRSMGPAPTREAAQVPNLQAATRGAIEAEMTPTTLGLMQDFLASIPGRASGAARSIGQSVSPALRAALEEVKRDPGLVPTGASMGALGAMGLGMLPYMVGASLADTSGETKKQDAIRARIKELERMIAEEEKKEMAAKE